MRCTRWGASIAGTCEIGFTQLTENDGARLIAELQSGILPCIGSRKDGGEYPDLDAPRAGQTTVRR
jgi:hypothetical protein